MSRPSTRTVLALLALAVLAIPATAGATHLFADVKDGHPHEAGITFAKNSGVSIGCKDGTVYCPEDFVTRAQMGTFMFRLSGTDPKTAPSVNADQVDGLDASGLMQSVVVGMDFNETVTLISDGTLHVTAQCLQDVAGNIDAIEFFTTSDVAGSVDSFNTPLAAGVPNSVFAGPAFVGATGVATYGTFITFPLGVLGPTGDVVNMFGGTWGVNSGGEDCILAVLVQASAAA